MENLARPKPASQEVTAMLELYDDPAILLGRDRVILASNRAYRELYGDTRPLEGRHCYEVSHHSKVPCEEAGEACPFVASAATGENQRVLHVHHTPRGEEHVDVETRPVRNERGEVVYFIEVMRQSKLASTQPSEQGLVGRAPAFNRMLELIGRVAPSEASVLLLGESGTGKELVAKAVHDGSRRAGGPFVPVECSGLTESLFESELFGHEKGAFTGANIRKMGLVEAARGGTLFLDEVGDIPLSMQVKLLRLLETGAYRRVGAVELQKADVRLICATHHKLLDMVEDGRFRRDLYYRISTFPIHLPALRERVEDLPLLVDTLLRRVSPERALKLHPRALACLEEYAFPGNIRELRNILERASLLADGDTIFPEHLPDACRGPAAAAATALPSGTVVTLEEAERRYLARVVREVQGDNRELAELLGVSERTLYRKLQELRRNGA